MRLCASRQIGAYNDEDAVCGGGGTQHGRFLFGVLVRRRIWTVFGVDGDCGNSGRCETASELEWNERQRLSKVIQF